MKHEDVIVFLGPTLRLKEARDLLDADYRPPASRGDVYRASKSDPRIVLLIDGAFESDAAVLHNEILWALSKGINVVGASSIGALRAAELAPFGMVGIGKIFEAYRDAGLERDDAVAVVHGPGELEYPLLSIALVDIWATLDRASKIGVLFADELAFLRGIASGIFYKQLGLTALIETAGQLGFPQQRAAILEQYLTAHGVFSQKRADAIEAISAISGETTLLMPAADPGFVFEHTSAWESLVSELEENDVNIPADNPPPSSETELATIGLILAEKEAQRRGYVLGRAEFEDTARRFRNRNNLNKFSDVQRWMEVAEFEHEDYVKLIEDEFFLEHSRALTARRLKDLISRVDRHRRSDFGLTSNP